MAEIPKLDNLKDKVPSKAPEKTNIFGEKSGVNLIESVKLNINPLQIPGYFINNKYINVSTDSPLYSNVGGWNAFQNFLVIKGVVKDPTNNSDENRKLANQLIEEFNSGTAVINGRTFDYIKNYPFNKITAQHVILAQTYHKISDPNVQIDGWVGSQTSQLRYPTPEGFYEWDTKEQDKTKNKKSNPEGNKSLPLIKENAYIPIIWGNKRFVVKVEEQVNNYYKTDGKSNIPPPEKWVLYEEDKFPNIKFAFTNGQPPKEWYTIGKSTEPNKSALALNTVTEKTNKIKENLKTQTKVVSDILSKGKSAISSAK